MRVWFRVVEMLMIAAGFVALSQLGRLFHEGADLDALLLAAIGLLCFVIPARGAAP